jgi:hypothetical protein
MIFTPQDWYCWILKSVVHNDHKNRKSIKSFLGEERSKIHLCTWWQVHQVPQAMNATESQHISDPSQSTMSMLHMEPNLQNLIGFSLFLHLNKRWTRHGKPKTYHDWQMRNCCHFCWLLLVLPRSGGYCLIREHFPSVDRCCHYSPSYCRLGPTRTCQKGLCSSTIPCLTRSAWVASLQNRPSGKAITALLQIQVHTRLFLQASKEAA